MDESSDSANRTLTQLDKARKAHDEVAIELERLKSDSRRREAELGAELRKSRYEVASLKTSFERENLALENERLKLEIKETIEQKTKLMEQLDAEKNLNSEMEVEMRKVRAELNQWRKAAEVAAAMVSNDDELFVERTRSMDRGFSFRFSSAEDFVKRKNDSVMNLLRGIWKNKKPHKS